MEVDDVVQSQLIVDVAHVQLLIVIEHPVIFVELLEQVIVFVDLSRLEASMDLKSIELPLDLSQVFVVLHRTWVQLNLGLIHFDLSKIIVIFCTEKEMILDMKAQIFDVNNCQIFAQLWL